MSVSVSDVEPDIGLATGPSEITIGRTTVQVKAYKHRRHLHGQCTKTVMWLVHFMNATAMERQ
jgi:hypothetical protein